MNVDAGALGQPSMRLSDDQLRDMMRLVKGSNSVELKLSVPASAHRATIQGLPLDPVEAQPRQIYFFDTPDLQLFRAGVVVRARRIAGGKGDTVVKLRPVDPAEIPSDLKNDPSFNIEVDALPGGYVCSASFKGRSSGNAIRQVVSGKRRLSKILSKPQRAFYQLHAPKGVDLDQLVPLGPTFILKDRFDTSMGLNGKADRSMVAEVWLYPDGSRILELSTKCEPSDALTVAAETRAYLVDKKVPTNGLQETKTRTALEFYSKQLMAEMAAVQAEERRETRRATARAASASASAAKPKAAAAAKPNAATKAKAATKPKPASKPNAASKPQPAAKPAAKTTPSAATAKTAPARRPAAAKTAAAKPGAARTRAATAARRTATRGTTRRTPPKGS